MWEPWSDAVQAAMEFPAEAIPFPSSSSGFQVATGQWLLYGITAGNTAASGGHITIYDGTDTSGPILLEITIGATTYIAPTYNIPVLSLNGLFVVPSAGVVIVGSVLAARVYPATPPVG